MPVQVDGEPWIQSPGEVVILKSALKVIGDRNEYIQLINIIQYLGHNVA